MLLTSVGCSTDFLKSCCRRKRDSESESVMKLAEHSWVGVYSSLIRVRACDFVRLELANITAGSVRAIIAREERARRRNMSHLSTEASRCFFFFSHPCTSSCTYAEPGLPINLVPINETYSFVTKRVRAPRYPSHHSAVHNRSLPKFPRFQTFFFQISNISARPPNTYTDYIKVSGNTT